MFRIIKHVNMKEVCFLAIKVIHTPHYFKVKGRWLNISESDPTLHWPLVPETIRINVEDIKNWKTYESSEDARKDSVKVSWYPPND